MSNDSGREDPTLAPETEPEVATNPHASDKPIEQVDLSVLARGAVPPPPRVPSDQELGASQLGSPQPPAWWEGSFVGQALSTFSRDADDIRKGRAKQHADQMAAIADLGRKQQSGQREVRGAIGRINDRLLGIENEQRRVRHVVESVERRVDESDSERVREAREIRTILTTTLLRLEMLEANGHDLESPLAGCSVLVVDDEVLLQNTMRRLLTKRGAEVITASSWEEVTAIKEERRVDFVVLDIKLAAEDGIQVAEWLTVSDWVTADRILLMTGHLDQHHSELATNLGLRVMLKPFGAGDLVRAIQESRDAAKPTSQTD